MQKRSFDDHLNGKESWKENQSDYCTRLRLAQLKYGLHAADKRL